VSEDVGREWDCRLRHWLSVAAVVVVGSLLAPSTACSPPSPEVEPSPPALDEEEPPALMDSLAALELLLGSVLLPASSNSNVAAYMPSEYLHEGDVVSSDSGRRYAIETPTWFVFIDDAPEAFFAHASRYVFIDAVTGEYDVVAETWPPEIGEASLWDADAHSWHLIEVLSILNTPLALNGTSSDAAVADYGDAPDGTDAYSGVPGHYPTLFSTSNSVADRPGCHTLTIGQETIGHTVSAEKDALDPSDPDGVPNLVDADSDERAFVILDETDSRLAYTVSVKSTAPDVGRYLNVLIDFNQDGQWRDASNGKEWAVTNMLVDLKPGESATVITPAFSWGTHRVRRSPVWMRTLLSRDRVDTGLFSQYGGWDGSGTFTYGEVEDHFVFLTEKPPNPTLVYWPPAPGLPPAGDGKKNGGGQPPAPGPAKGPCGYDINYHVLIINCGDNGRDLSRGAPIVGESCDAVAGAAGDQGYNQVGNLAPGGDGDSKTSLANIGKAFDNLASAVKCGDHVLIYVCGHGREDGGIAIKSTSGTTQEVMKPTDNGSTDDGKDNSLKDFLGKIPACPDEECDKAGCCCNVTVVLESCFAGNFDVDGVTGEGRTVVGTSTDTESWATYPGGGAYTQGLVDGMRDADTDTDDPPNGVEPMEAHENGKQSVDENNRARGKGQEPWEDSQTCECKCPCEPDIDVDKWVMVDIEGEWLDQVAAEPGDRVRFMVEIENTGECRDIIDLEMMDQMAPCLEYAGNATVDFDGDEQDIEPDQILRSSGGTVMRWGLSELGPLSPGQFLTIEYDAIALETGPNINKATAGGHCSYDYSTIVVDADLAIVLVHAEESPPPTPEDVLQVEIEVEAESSGGLECQSFVTVWITARDLTGGDYPVEHVNLAINGLPWFDSGPLSTMVFSKTLGFDANCGQPFDFVLTAVNSVGVHATTAQTMTTPLP